MRITVKIFYPTLTAELCELTHEQIPAEVISQGVAELRAHTKLMPLVPGDVVRYDRETNQVLDVISYEPTWLVDVTFQLAANIRIGEALPDDDKSRVKIREVMDAWQREAYVTRTTTYSCLVSAPDKEWIADRVQNCPYVEHMDLIRFPDMAMNFAVAVNNADVDDLTTGPWA